MIGPVLFLMIEPLIIGAGLTSLVVGQFLYQPFERRSQYGVVRFEDVARAKKRVLALKEQVKFKNDEIKVLESKEGEFRAKAKTYLQPKYSLINACINYRKQEEQGKTGWFNQFNAKTPFPTTSIIDPETNESFSVDKSNINLVIKDFEQKESGLFSEAHKLLLAREESKREVRETQSKINTLEERIPVLKDLAQERLICKLNQFSDHNLV